MTMTAMALDQLVTTDTAAEILGVHRNSVYRYSYTYADFPQPTKVGRTLLHDPAALQQWRDEHPAIGR